MNALNDTSNFEEPSEIQLEDAMRSIAEGDPDAFALLYEHYLGFVIATAYKVLNDRHESEEVAQEVFSKLWVKAQLYDKSRGKPKSWLATMARNRAIDRYRSIQRRCRLRDEVQEQERSEPKRESLDVLASVQRQEEALALRSAVMKLNPSQRQAVELTFFKGLTHKQAAAKGGQPLGTMKARIRRGLIRLRTAVPQLEPSLQLAAMHPKSIRA